jgi:ribokinase
VRDDPSPGLRLVLLPMLRSTGGADCPLPTGMPSAGTTLGEQVGSDAPSAVRPKPVHPSDHRLASAGPASVLASGRPRGRVVVIGAAVMEAAFCLDDLPRPGDSVEAHRFRFRPGGRGLQRAVAAARQGQHVSLVAPVADDRFGLEIIHYLQANQVHTSLLKIVPGAQTPITGVLESVSGRIVVRSPDKTGVRLDPWDLEVLFPDLRHCDAVLTTSEVPQDIVNRLLAVLPQLVDDI